MPSLPYSSQIASARLHSLYSRRDVPRMTLTPSAAAASAASAGKRSGQFVASNSKACSGRWTAVTESVSLMTAAPARTRAVQIAVSACFESIETLRTVISPAVAPATSSIAAALQSPSMLK